MLLVLLPCKPPLSDFETFLEHQLYKQTSQFRGITTCYSLRWMLDLYRLLFEIPRQRPSRICWKDQLWPFFRTYRMLSCFTKKKHGKFEFVLAIFLFQLQSFHIFSEDKDIILMLLLLLFLQSNWRNVLNAAFPWMISIFT